MSIDWNAVIDAAHAATEEHGINVRGGRKYLQVAQRVELFRLNFPAYGIETDLLHFGPAKGASIVVAARVTDESGRVVATGIAEEIRGQGNVNTTSSVENAETSAIGRALAALGLHGGEFASLNEVERATNPDVVSNAKAAQEKPPEPTSADKAKWFIGNIAKAGDPAALSNWLADEKRQSILATLDAEDRAHVEATAETREAELQEKAA